MSPAWGSLLLMIWNPLGMGEGPRHWQGAHGWQSPLGTRGQGAHTHLSPLLPAGCPGPAERAFISPQSLSPRQPTSLHWGRRRRAQPGSSWLGLALFAGEQSLAEPNSPFPARIRPYLGKLYIHRDKPHICFLTVGIAPTGMERTGSLLSPSPCD